jgi:hypothetical protein
MMRLKGLIGLVWVMVLTGCSVIPIPVKVDLREHLGEHAQGAYQQEILAGAFPQVDWRYPTTEGTTIDFSGTDIPVRVHRAQAQVNIAFTYDGAPLSGEVRAQVYLAPAGSDSLWQTRYALGAPQVMALEQRLNRLEDTVVLTGEQVRALNEKQVRWGIKLTGSAGAQESGVRVLRYRVDTFELHAGVGVF